MLQKITSLFLWLFTKPSKSSIAEYVKVDGSNKRILAYNKKKIYFSDITIIDSKKSEKNYSRIVTSNNDIFYYNDSISNITKLSSEPFVRISKTTSINYKFCNERFNNSAIFINGLPFPIGESYKKDVEAFFLKMQSENI